jgi:hypothetical protein
MKMYIIAIAALTIAISTAFAQNDQNSYLSGATYNENKHSYVPPAPAYKPSESQSPPNYEALSNNYKESQEKFKEEKLPLNEFKTGDNSTLKVEGSLGEVKSVKGTYKQKF